MLYLLILQARSVPLVSFSTASVSVVGNERNRTDERNRPPSRKLLFLLPFAPLSTSLAFASGFS